MKKYIFPVGVLVFVILVSMSITHFTQKSVPKRPEYISGWKHVAFDQLGNSYYIDADSITLDSRDDVEMRFHAIYRKVYTDKGREAIAQSYVDSGVDMSEMANVDHEIDLMNFRDVNGIKFVTSANCKFYKADGTEIPTLEMNVEIDEKSIHPIPEKSIGENLYDYAYTRVPKE